MRRAQPYSAPGPATSTEPQRRPARLDRSARPGPVHAGVRRRTGLPCALYASASLASRNGASSSPSCATSHVAARPPRRRRARRRIGLTNCPWRLRPLQPAVASCFNCRGDVRLTVTRGSSQCRDRRGTVRAQPQLAAAAAHLRRRASDWPNVRSPTFSEFRNFATPRQAGSAHHPAPRYVIQCVRARDATLRIARLAG